MRNTYLLMKTMPDEKFSNWAGKQLAIMVPSDELQCQMYDMKLPLIIYIRNRHAYEGSLASFRGPNVMNDAYF